MWITVKSPDHIKNGLSYCSRLTCGEKDVECPYDCGSCECISHLAEDALDYIQSLESALKAKEDEFDEYARKY